MRDLRTHPGIRRDDQRTTSPAESDPARDGGLLLLTGTPREILARIVPGDPLRLRARVAEHLLRRALLLDADRVLLRAFALCARSALSWRGRPVLDRWLEARIEEAVDQILEHEGAALACGTPTARGRDDGQASFSVFASPLGLDPVSLRRSTARFNRLDAEEREAFFLLVVEGRSLDDVWSERGGSASALARSARHAMDVLRGANSPSPLPPPSKR